MVSVGIISAKLSDLHDNIAKLSHELEAKRKENESQKNIVKKLDSEIKDKHRFIDSLEQKSEQHREAIRVNTERLCELQKSAAECQKAHESLEKRLESQEESIQLLEDEVREAQNLAKSSAQLYDEVIIVSYTEFLRPLSNFKKTIIVSITATHERNMKSLKEAHTVALKRINELEQLLQENNIPIPPLTPKSQFIMAKKT
ncbi:unnamed protein product [Schistosoma turkestanicum]|nr:unnamed protein product [Schistosoma turkestanicum]